MAKINYNLAEGIHGNLVQNVRENYEKYYRLAYSLVRNEEVAAGVVTKTVYFSLYNGRKLKDTPSMHVWFLQLIIKEGMRTMYRNDFKRDFTTDSQLYAYMETVEPASVNAFKLYYFEELSVEKIGGALHFSNGEVNHRIAYVRNELKIDSSMDEESLQRLEELRSIYEGCPVPANLEEQVEKAIAQEEENFATYIVKDKRNRILKPLGLVAICAAFFFLTVSAGRSNPDFADAVMAVPLVNHIFGSFF